MSHLNSKVLGTGNFVIFTPWLARSGQQPSSVTLDNWRHMLCFDANVIHAED